MTSNSDLLQLLRSHAVGETELSSTHLKAVEILLRSEASEPVERVFVVTGVPRRQDQEAPAS
jgi:hypothetical protein